MSHEAAAAAPEVELTAQERATAEASTQYTTENVKILKDADHIRQRPGMYIGDTGQHGLHHLIYELVHNCVDEALAGYCSAIHVRVHVDNSVSVSDDGRGIPVEVHPQVGKPTLEVVMTTVGAGAKFDKGAYKVSAGLHGMGAKAVTALSEWVEAQVQRNGRTYTQEYERGKAITPVKDVGASKRTGTKITFKPDPQIFHEIHFNYDTLETRFRELAFLNKGLAIRLTDDRAAKDQTFKFDGGIAEFVGYLNRDEDRLVVEPLYVDRSVESEHGPIRVEVAMQYVAAEEERCRCYTNNAYNPMGGTHLSGFRTALTRTLNAYGTRQELFKNVTPIGEDFRKGLTAIISVQHPDPQFNAQTKEKLNNLDVEGAVSGVLSEFLNRYLEENPKEATRIMKKALLEAEAREAAARAKKALKERKGLLSSGGLPGKLMDCTARDPDESELFLVEGDSAGGSAESGRDRIHQAILPLRGKPLNVEKARMENLLKNEEISNLISAIGIDIGLGIADDAREETLKGLRYGKIIIMTDADVDGQHIRTLLLTFFYRQMPLLVAAGRIYVARPPLFKVTEKKHVRFVQTVEEMNQELITRGLKGTRLAVFPRPAGPDAPIGEPRRIDGDDLTTLMKQMIALEEALGTLERRGVNLASFLTRLGPRGLPSFHVVVAGREEWCYTAEEVAELQTRERERLGHDLVVEDEPTAATTNGHGHAPLEADTFREEVLHEVRVINKALDELRRFGLDPKDLVPPERVAGREPPPRLRLESGDSGHTLNTLRELSADVRRLGGKGLSINRFKGLGEMDPEELWETTLDPDRRTLLQVQLEDALKADEMFRTLMGEKVEPRRDFIYKYAIEVKDIDYHGA
ncbi:MAG: DNA gyrase subunit B [Gemmataceae bacterium]